MNTNAERIKEIANACGYINCPRVLIYLKEAQSEIDQLSKAFDEVRLHKNKLEEENTRIKEKIKCLMVLIDCDDQVYEHLTVDMEGLKLIEELRKEIK